MKFLHQRTLSPAASELVQFDSDSIRQVVSSEHLTVPDVWLADPDAYEKNGRIFRDSDSPRMLAYSTRDHVLYATDGCNACTRRVETQLERLPSEELREFAVENGIPPGLLQALVSHFTDSR
jgi:hypothetical protein